MFQIILKIICFLLIILILVRIPEKDGGSLNLNIARSILGTSQNSSLKFSQNITWFLIFMFLLLNSLIVFQNF
jgi:preprotein translocase subunit SecG